MVLVTATPHSGNEDAFRSLLALLDDDFADLPVEDLDRAGREGVRRRLARHLVQRRRADIRRYLETDTAFPERRDKEAAYTFSRGYRALFDDILAFAHEYVTEKADDVRPAPDDRTPAEDRRGQRGQRRRRVRYWSALALLRCVSSSPAAAAATLRSRAAVDAAEGDDVDEVGRRTVLDQGDDDDAVALDFSPGADAEESPESTRRRLLELARRVEALEPQGRPQAPGRGARGEGAPRGRIPPGGLLPLRRHRGVRRPAPARRPREGRQGGAGHRPAAAGRARGAHRPAHR